MSLEDVFNGLFAGSVYALVALGLAIVFQPTRIMNFAQGEALVLGAAIGYQVVTLNGWGWGAAIPITLLLGIVAGVAMERLIVLPVRVSGSRYAWIIATLAVALVFQSLFTLQYLNVDALRPEALISGDVPGLEGKLSWQQLLTIGVALAVMGAYDLFLRRSVYGRAIRAASHSDDTSVLMGIPVSRIVMLSFVIGTVITATAGLLAAAVIFVAPASGLTFTIKGFIAAVIGGVGSPRGALAGGLIVGLLDTLVPVLFSGSIGDFAIYIALAAILVLFPSGLFGRPMEAH